MNLLCNFHPTLPYQKLKGLQALAILSNVYDNIWISSRSRALTNNKSSRLSHHHYLSLHQIGITPWIWGKPRIGETWSIYSWSSSYTTPLLMLPDLEKTCQYPESLVPMTILPQPVESNFKKWAREEALDKAQTQRKAKQSIQAYACPLETYASLIEAHASLLYGHTPSRSGVRH